MSMPQRLGLLLLGLILVAAAVHGPLHEEGQDCGPMTLCGVGAVLAVACLAVGLMLVSGPAQDRSPACLRVPRGARSERPRGRAPPR